MKITKNVLKKFTIFAIIFQIFCINILATDQSASEFISNYPEISSKSHMLVDQTTGNVLLEHNADLKIFPASTTKILTAIVVLENSTLDEMVTVTKEALNVPAGSSSAGLVEGEVLPVLDMLYCLMLPSANEAANALALHIGDGDMSVFVKLMNDKAVELGATNSNFVNPNGLHDENHYTTARDMAKITMHAVENETFNEVVNTAQKTISPSNKNSDGKKVYTTNHLILKKSDPRYYQYADGIKTGFTTPAGACLVSNANKNDRKLISLIYGGTVDSTTKENSVFKDSKALFEWGYENYKHITLLDTLEPIVEMPVRLSSKTDYVSLTPAQDVKGLVPVNYTPENVVFTYNMPENVNAPIEKDQVLGTVTITYNKMEYGTVELKAVSDVEISKVLYYVDKIENFFDSTLFKIILAVLVIILLITSFNKKSRAKRRKAKINEMRNKRIRKY